MMIFVYVVFVFLILRFCVTLFNFLSNPKLGYYGKHFTDKVSVIVWSNGTQDGISSTLDSIDEQEYKNIEIIVRQDKRLEELTAKATGKYFFFVTPGTTLHRGLINNLIYRTKVFNLTVLSLIPTYRASGLRAQVLYPLSDFLLLNLLPLRLVRLSNLPAFAAGSSDCLFFDASLYQTISWNQLSQMPPAIDVVKLVKQQQLKAEVLLGNKMIQKDIVDIDLSVFAPGLLLHFSNSSIVAFVYVVLVVFGPLITLLGFDPELLILPFGLIFMSRVMIAFMSAQNPVRNVLLHPLQMISLFMLMLYAMISRIQTSFKLK